MSEDAKHHEIVIIRRGGHGDHDEHHGGVWKIAFADFMTAMMAFFLVMWLISANDKTRASVARYFNPVRLVDATTQPRGLHDTKKDESGITASPDSKKPADEKGEAKKSEAKAPPPPETPAQKEKRLDGALRDNPLAALAEIASTAGLGERSGGTLHSAAPVIGRKGGDAFRDPFAPPPAPAAGSGADDEAAQDKLLAQMAEAEPQPQPQAPAAPKKAEAAGPAKPAKAGQGEADAKAVLAALQPNDHEAGPKVDVRQTPEGLVLSLTDTANFTMFANGSAVPARQVVLLMERMASVIEAKAGVVVIRGFTDNKPFRESRRYDNWHLSLDRAQVAHYMLVRGGLDDARISHVEGYADRGGKPGVDPASPLNRRIEILLKDKP